MATAAGSFRNSKSAASSGRYAVESSLVKGFVSVSDVICNCCLWVIIFAVPLMMAGIRESGVAVFVGSSLLMGVVWAVQQLVHPQGRSAFCPAVILGFAALALVSVQLVPLPQTLVRSLSPFAADFFPAWESEQSLLPGSGYWSRISLTPSLTRSGLVLLFAYVVLFLTLLQRLQSLNDVDAVLRLIAISTMVMAGIGLGQLFLGNGKFLWIVEHPLRTASWPAKGTFTNQNHFAHFLALGIGPLVWWWKKLGPIQGKTIQGRVRNHGFGISRSSASHQQVVGAAIAVVILAGILSFSRGGIACIALAAGLSLASLGKEWKSVFQLAVPVVAFMTAGVFLFGTDMLESKWNRLSQAESLADLCRGRYLLWSALLTAAYSFWPAGSGVGSHAEVVPTWMKDDLGKRFSHAESGYLQVLIETGLPGLMLVLAAVMLVVWWGRSCWKASENEDRMRIIIICAGLLVSGLHSLVDFVWYIPACLITALILAACLCRIRQVSSESHNQNHDETFSTKWPTCWAVIVILMVVSVGRLSADIVIRDAESEASWMSYRGLAVGAGRARSYESMESVDERLDRMIDHLETCIDVDSGDHRAMSDLAALYLRRFERNQVDADNPMTVREIKNTVEAAEFQSPRETLSWLKKAFGKNVVDLYRALALSRQAAAGQPLRGENYLLLAQLGFLQGVSPDDESTLIDQALKLRPHKAPVLYFAGLAEVEKGNFPQAYEQWKKAFHLDAKIRPTIIRTLAPYLTPDEIITGLQPGADGLWLMIREYESLNLTEQRHTVLERYIKGFRRLAQQEDASESLFWIRSHDVFQSAGEEKKAVACLAQAVKRSPTDYGLRKKYAFALMNVHASGPAVHELEWCQLRKPDDQEITQALKTLTEMARREVPDESM